MRIQSSLCLVLSLLVLPCLRVSGSAQQPAQEHPASAIRTHAHDVLLPVTVVDKHGALVTNLAAKDFTLTEDGRPQVIKGFTTQSDLPFRLGLLMDTSRGIYPAIDGERKGAGKFIDLVLPDDPKAAAHGDQVFLIHFDREVELLEDFTNSRDKLHRELDAMTPASRERNAQGPERSGDDRDYGRQPGSRFGGTQLYDAIWLASDELMKPKGGRKALVVLSNGIDRGSKETLNDAIDAADRANVQVFTIYFKGEEERTLGNYPGGGHHGGMGGGYPGGGWPGGSGGGGGDSKKSQADGRKIMQQIASRTGGQFFEAKKKDNFEEIYGLIANALHQQYLLIYTPDKTDTGGEYHKIALKTGNNDLTVITREGYYAPSPDK